MTVINGIVSSISYVKYDYGNTHYTKIYDQDKVPSSIVNNDSMFILSRNNVPFKAKHYKITSKDCYVQDEHEFILSVSHAQISTALSFGLDSDGYFNSRFVWIKAPTLKLVVENSEMHKIAIKVSAEKCALKKVKQIPSSELIPGNWYLLKNGNCIYYHNRLKKTSNQSIRYFIYSLPTRAREKFQGIKIIEKFINDTCARPHSHVYFSEVDSIKGVIQKIDCDRFNLDNVQISVHAFDQLPRPVGYSGYMSPYVNYYELVRQYEPVV